MMEDKPKISIVLPVYNSEKTLSQCLDSLMALDFPPEDREIIVVNNNSTDDSKRIILKYPVTYLFEPNQGRAWARNRGVKNAQGEFIAFIDSDCIATKDWLKELYEGILEDENIAICGGEILPLKQETIFERYMHSISTFSQKIGIEGQFEESLPRVVTANAICRKRIIEDVGYFDEDLVTYEDTELSWRVCLAGYEIKLIPHARVYHQHLRTFLKFCQHHFEYGLAHRVVYQKYRKFVQREEVLSFKKAPLRFLTEDFLFHLFYDVRYFFEEAKKADLSFLLGYVLQKISHGLGWLVTAFRQMMYGEKSKEQPKVPLEKFFHNRLIFSQNGTTWSLNCPTTWFLNSGFIKMIVYKDFRIYKFNEAGTKIWLSLLKTEDLKKTKHEICDYYHLMHDTVDKDVDDFLTMLEKEEILKRINVKSLSFVV